MEINPTTLQIEHFYLSLDQMHQPIPYTQLLPVLHVNCRFVWKIPDYHVVVYTQRVFSVFV